MESVRWRASRPFVSGFCATGRASQPCALHIGEHLSSVIDRTILFSRYADKVHFPPPQNRCEREKEFGVGCLREGKGWGCTARTARPTRKNSFFCSSRSHISYFVCHSIECRINGGAVAWPPTTAALEGWRVVFLGKGGHFANTRQDCLFQRS